MRTAEDTRKAELLYIFGVRPPDPQLIGFLEEYDRHIGDLALALREMILDEMPDASESVYQVYTVAIWFGLSGKMRDMFCYIATSTNHVNLGFPRGATMPDPNRVMEGTGKGMRHIKLRKIEDLDRPYLRRYIRSAIEQLGSDRPGTRETFVKPRGAAKRKTVRR